MFCFPPHPLTRLRLADGVTCQLAPGRAELRVGSQRSFVITDAPVLRLLGALESNPLTAAQGENRAAAERVLIETGLATVEFLASPRGEVVAALSSAGYGQALRLDAPAFDWPSFRRSTPAWPPYGWPTRART